jgi:hypothetical protein
MSEEPKTKKPAAVPFWVWILVGVLALGLISFALDDGETTATDSTSATQSDDSEPADAAESSDAGETLPSLGELASTDDGVDVTVLAVNYDQSSPNEWAVDEPKGQLASVKITIFNGSNEAVELNSYTAKAYIGGAEYEASAAFGPNGDWLAGEELNPGLGIEIDAFFDIPEGAELTEIEFQTAIIFGDALRFSLTQ